ncbi:protein UXT isoform X3 [Betta splendens]|nr:protein UXT isoform X3 [Betta splendens]XP_055366513.1 protein UXT isoform X3 [Betta splendens]XP_055366514.1 protein UXT isoform X3 [Betta splendens]
MSPPANASVNQKILQYEGFINEVLMRDLGRVLEQRDTVYEKIAEYLQLKNTIQSLQVHKENAMKYGKREQRASQVLSPADDMGPHVRRNSDSRLLKTDVDLGCHFYIQAEVEDSSRVFVAVGYGFFVEMTHTEALRFIDKKTSQLTAFTEQLTKDSAKIKANIRMVLEGLRELQGLTDLPDATRREVF